MKSRIDFLVAGNQKCGTNTLHDLLAQHPTVRMSSPKEMHYFDRASFADCEDAHRDYHRRGWAVGEEGLDEQLLYGESTPKYVLFRPSGEPRYLPRIRAYNPAIKLVVLFRDPVERAYSQWNMLRDRGRAVPPFEDIVDAALDASAERSPWADVIDRGCYGRVVFNLLSLFAPERCCFVKVDDLNHQVDVVERFLGIEPFDYEPRYSYALEYESPLAPAVGERLRGHYRAEMHIFSRLTGLDVDDWVN
ncbi:MAG: sulfotransferase domain-containing protein [Acidimicrobiales bacterium]|nr:sulfotransferase domain-containing protein [Acidimicrobiales bacterium]